MRSEKQIIVTFKWLAGSLALLCVYLISGCEAAAPSEAHRQYIQDARNSYGYVNEPMPAMPEHQSSEPENGSITNSDDPLPDDGVATEPAAWPDWLRKDCEENEDCGTNTAGYCFKAAGDKGYCTIACIEECPEYFGCVAVASTNGPDALFLCVTNTVCEPGEGASFDFSFEGSTCPGTRVCGADGQWAECTKSLNVVESCDGKVDEGCSSGCD